MATPSTMLVVRDDSADVTVRLAIAGFLAGVHRPDPGELRDGSSRSGATTIVSNCSM